MREFVAFLPFLLGATVVALATDSGKPADQAQPSRLPALMRNAPVIQPQPDGVVCLDADAAGIIKWQGSQVELVNDGGGLLKVQNDRIALWNADIERPCWKLYLPKGGKYRVVINRSTATGRESTATISFRGQTECHVTNDIESSGGWDVFKPYVMGETELDAGEQIVEYRPIAWKSANFLINLVDIRLIPLDACARLEPSARKGLSKLGIDSDPQIADLSRKEKSLQSRSQELNKTVQTRDFSGFADYGQFLEYDRLAPEQPVVDRELQEVRKKLGDLKLAKFKALSNGAGVLGPAEAKSVEEYFIAAVTVAEGDSREYPKVFFKPAGAAVGGNAASHNPLFPTGHLESLPRQQIDEKLSAVTISVQPPPDAAERMRRFGARDSDEGLAALCAQFRRVIKSGIPGLENFDSLCAQHRYREALEAYRAYFFDKLADPQKYGAVETNILFQLTRERGKGDLLMAPSPLALERNMRGGAVGQINDEVVSLDIGQPGAVSWVPYGLTIPPDAPLTWRNQNENPFWRTPQGKNAARIIEFYRCVTVLPSDRGEYRRLGFFPALLFSYAATGDKSHLARWCEYLDDWAMNAKEDQESFPIDVRKATELEPQQIHATLTLFRIILDERPEFARDFDAASLARLLMKLHADYMPYTIRMHRAEMANWAIMGLWEQLNVDRFFREFKAVDYYNREAWRLWSINLIQHRALDGENIEAWDEGHNVIDVEYGVPGMTYGWFPGVDDLDRIDFFDGLKTNERDLLTHVSPAGYYWPSWAAATDLVHNNVRTHYNKPIHQGHTFLDLIDSEPGVKSRIDTIMNAGRPVAGPLPAQTSDIAPYMAMYYLRDSWQPGAEYFLMQNPLFRSQDMAINYSPGEGLMGGSARTMYDLSKNGRTLIAASSLAVDRKPDNRNINGILTGGKTDYCGESGRNVVQTRFHTSARFDLAEARQDAPYCRPRVKFSSGDLYGLYAVNPDGDNRPVTDVSDYRQVFSIHGEGLYIVNDRIINTGSGGHEYSQFFSLPLRLGQQGLTDRVRLLAAAGYEPIKIEEAAGQFATANPGFDNISARCFASGPLTFGGILNGSAEFASIDKAPMETLKTTLASGVAPSQAIQLDTVHPFSIHWNGSGNQSLITALYTRPAVFDLKTQYENDLKSAEETKGPGGVLGCHMVTRSGADVAFQTGPRAANHLICGPIVAEAESLLVVQKAGEQTAGILLGAKSVELNGKPAALPGADFEFAVTGDSTLDDIKAIHCPIDTTRISPESNVFTDEADVTFDIPTQKTDDIEFRYTLDGVDPTIDSALYSQPVVLRETTMVKVRPFRKGLKETPWNFTGTDSGKTISAIFRKQAPQPAVTISWPEPGLRYEYFEGDWPTILLTYAGGDGVLDPKSSGLVKSLLDPAELADIRKTDRAYAVRYSGYLHVPAGGVYDFYAPDELYKPTIDAGYDLRVFIDGQEWFPSPTLHSENVWHIALEQGFHRLSISYVDYRWKSVFRDDFMMSWQEEEMWNGRPVLEMSGPGMKRQAVPQAFLFRQKMNASPL